MTINPQLPRNDAMLLLCEVAQMSASVIYDIHALILTSKPEDESEALADLDESLGLLMSAARQLQKKVQDARIAKNGGA